MGPIIMEPDEAAAYGGNVNLTRTLCTSAGRIQSSGIFMGTNPLHYSLPFLLLQLSLASSVILLLSRLLRPLGQPVVVSQILVRLLSSLINSGFALHVRMYVLLLPGGSSNRSMDTKERRQKDIYNWRFHWGGAYDTGHHQGFHRYKPSQFRMLKKVKAIDHESFEVMCTSMLVVAGSITPIIKYLYDPSRRYLFYKRTVMHSKPNAELRVLVCMHDEENVHTTINLLQALYPTNRSPMAIYVLHLVELVGRAKPLLIPHKLTRKSSSKATMSQRIVNAFRF
ncbi:Cation/H(+) antiporter 15 [Vitis vinifera]|uniref:Cation/H(+) antiporter 15 n=1 Tax=Vitis vinifera TaxID=29760 RepID=A0A438JCS8_VITVI|nr:Cation/H(+) antiporter 15 [Vitis vinifera]